MSVVDIRYARALASVVAEQSLAPATVQQQLQDFATMFASSADLREVLQDPSMPEPQKLGVLDALAAKTGIDKTVRNFIATIASHQRLHDLTEIVAAYATLSDQSQHVAEVDITSARELSDASRKLLEEQVGKLAGGQQVRATYHQDPALLGGAVVRLGSTIYDGSVRTQLQQMKQQLISAVAN